MAQGRYVRRRAQHIPSTRRRSSAGHAAGRDADGPSRCVDRQHSHRPPGSRHELAVSDSGRVLVAYRPVALRRASRNLLEDAGAHRVRATARIGDDDGRVLVVIELNMWHVRFRVVSRLQSFAYWVKAYRESLLSNSLEGLLLLYRPLVVHESVLSQEVALPTTLTNSS